MNLELERLITRAEQKAREEECAPMECGHPRACRVIANERDTVFTCLACTREQRAVEEACKNLRERLQTLGDALAEAEARVRRECAEIARSFASTITHTGVDTRAIWANDTAIRIADAIERGE